MTIDLDDIDPDDVAPSHAECDPERNYLCLQCRAEQAAEFAEFRREWLRDEKPLLELERDLGMTRDEMLRDAGRSRGR